MMIFPWLIAVRIVPTISATMAERRTSGPKVSAQVRQRRRLLLDVRTSKLEPSSVFRQRSHSARVRRVVSDSWSTICGSTHLCATEMQCQEPALFPCPAENRYDRPAQSSQKSREVPLMKDYPAENIRNVALVGHSGTGKTSLAEALMLAARATNRL